MFYFSPALYLQLFERRPAARLLSTMAKSIDWKPAVFKGKDRDARIQGILTADGMKHFRRASAKLAKLVGHDVSHADTIEYLARGHEATIAYIDKQQQQ